MAPNFYVTLTIGCLLFNLSVVVVFYKLSPEGTSFSRLLFQLMVPLCTWEVLLAFIEYPDDMLDWLFTDLGPLMDVRDPLLNAPHHTAHIVHSHGDVPIHPMVTPAEQFAD
ncbi:unnamed protein product [Toxocara canis]|uniref:PhoLip_ATPase_C domain-containing protein n=1 Tax=Toxocara canis TaxID=6265 RepID=A0A183UFU2_TOXCA|nr:unnamed protein product [Toxocara canis]